MKRNVKKIILPKHTALLKEVIADALSIGIDFFGANPHQIDENVYLMKRKYTLGLCKKRRTEFGDYVYQISFSKNFLALTGQHVKNVLMHELIHTLPNCFNHGTEFKRVMRLVNSKLPQYNVDTRCRGEEWKQVNAIISEKKEDAKKEFVEVDELTQKQRILGYLLFTMTAKRRFKRTILTKLIKEMLKRNEVYFIKYIYKVYPYEYNYVYNSVCKREKIQLNKITM